MFCRLGHDALCIGKDAAKINMILKGGGLPIYEPGREHLLERDMRTKRRRVSTDTAASVKGRDMIRPLAMERDFPADYQSLPDFDATVAKLVSPP